MLALEASSTALVEALAFSSGQGLN